MVFSNSKNADKWEDKIIINTMQINNTDKQAARLRLLEEHKCKRALHKQLGLCTLCNNPVVPGFRLCQKHRLVVRACRDVARARTQVNVINITNQPLNTKIQNILGEDGIQRPYLIIELSNVNEVIIK